MISPSSSPRTSHRRRSRSPSSIDDEPLKWMESDGEGRNEVSRYNSNKMYKREE